MLASLSHVPHLLDGEYGRQVHACPGLKLWHCVGAHLLVRHDEHPHVRWLKWNSIRRMRNAVCHRSPCFHLMVGVHYPPFELVKVGEVVSIFVRHRLEKSGLKEQGMPDILSSQIPALTLFRKPVENYRGFPQQARRGGSECIGLVPRTVAEQTFDQRRARLAHDTCVRPLTSKAKPLVFVYEAGPCGSWLSRDLTKHHLLGGVVASSLVPKQAGDRVKTARRDATQLARLMRSGNLTPVDGPAVADEAIRDRARGCHPGSPGRQEPLEGLPAAPGYPV